MDGIPVGRELGKWYLKEHTDRGDADGSVMVVIATDAPLSDRNLTRLATRAMAGLARTGAAFSDGSGDYAIAFATHPGVRRDPERRAHQAIIADWPNDRMSPLFVAAAEAVEEAVLNALTMATTIIGRDGRTGRRATGHAIDLDALRAVLKKHGR